MAPKKYTIKQLCTMIGGAFVVITTLFVGIIQMTKEVGKELKEPIKYEVPQPSNKPPTETVNTFSNFDGAMLQVLTSINKQMLEMNKAIGRLEVTTEANSIRIDTAVVRIDKLTSLIHRRGFELTTRRNLGETLANAVR